MTTGLRCTAILLLTRMWANAQRDGRPAEYRWRPLRKFRNFISSRRKVWLTPASGLPCSNAAKTRNPLKFAGVPHTRQQISAASGPTFAILWGHVEEILLQICMCPDGDFCVIFAFCISSEPRAVHFRPAF